MEKKSQIYKIYSRNRMKFFNIKNEEHKVKQYHNEKLKIFYVIFVFCVIFSIYAIITRSVIPIFEKICSNEARSIATKITNEESTRAIKQYNYEDLFTIDKDDTRKDTNDKSQYIFN